MHDAPPPTSTDRSTGNSRLSHFLGVGLLLGMALLFSAYLWSSRESHAVQPVNVVTLRPPVHGSSAAVEIVPYRHELQPAEPGCPETPAGQICLIIGPEIPTPESKTFT